MSFTLAYETQAKIWNQHKEANEKAHKRHEELTLQGHVVTLETKLQGPYANYIGKYYSNGEYISFLELSSLSWAVDIVGIY